MPRVLVLHSLAEACSALWPLHPKRALELAESGGPVTLLDVALLCSARPGEVALLLSRTRPKKPDKRSPRHTRSTKTMLVHVWMQPQLKHYLQAAAERERLDISSAVRVAVWEYVQRHLPSAPREGSRRAPAVEWVKPPERRRSRR